MIMISNEQRDILVRFVEEFSVKADHSSTKEANLSRRARKAIKEIRKRQPFKL